MDLRLATCSYSEFRPTIRVPVRFTAGHPRWRLPYELAGKAPLITPTRAMLAMSDEEYVVAYRKQLDDAGVDAIADELVRFRYEDGPVVLLCFENLSKPDLWCHRTLFAAWWQEQTGDEVPELGAVRT